MAWRIKIQNIRDVAEYQLCSGCGACAYISPDEINMVDAVDYGRRPPLPDGEPKDSRTAEAMKVCPGIGLAHSFDRKDPGLIRELMDAWGPIYEVWEGHAADPEIRFAGSSGGAASALALFCIEKLGFHGVLHTAARPDVPYLNHTVLSTTREEILARTGSRYAPASPCDGLKMIEDAPGPCVFIGKPCDVAAVRKAAALRPKLADKVGLTIAFFCAGTPSTRGTLELLKRMGVEDPSALLSLRYRGHGWPGEASATWTERGVSRTSQLSYEESWGQLTKFVQWRCRLCPDHTGEFADIAVGDPWYRKPSEGEPGRSLVLCRTSVGAPLLREARAEGGLTLERSEPATLPNSQENLLRTRGAVWGRLLALRLLGAAVPAMYGFPMVHVWLTKLGITRQMESLLGTARRVFRRRLSIRRPVGSPIAEEVA